VAAPVYGFGAPVAGSPGSPVVAAVSVSGPSYRFVARSFAAVAASVTAAAEDIGARAGGAA
jgi:DNA-binding IclR family transcriptional regulator